MFRALVGMQAVGPDPNAVCPTPHVDVSAAFSVQASYVGDSCCAAVGNGDLVLISAGPSYYATVNSVAVQARQAGLRSGSMWLILMFCPIEHRASNFTRCLIFCLPECLAWA